MGNKMFLSTYFLERIEIDRDVDLVDLLKDICTLFGWTHATYFGTGLVGENIGEEFILTTYDNAWVERYNSQEYKYIDPILLMGTQSLLPLDWSIIPGNDERLKLFFGEARELGVEQSGLTIAVRGLLGDSSLFSINSNETGRAWELRKAEILSDLTYFAHLFHDIVLRRHTTEMYDARPRLTRREQEVLRWAANGKTAWETARILKLSEKTVSFYLSNVTAKLNVATKTQAVARAISERLLIM